MRSSYISSEKLNHAHYLFALGVGLPRVLDSRMRAIFVYYASTVKLLIIVMNAPAFVITRFWKPQRLLETRVYLRSTPWFFIEGTIVSTFYSSTRNCPFPVNISTSVRHLQSFLVLIGLCCWHIHIISAGYFLAFCICGISTELILFCNFDSHARPGFIN